MANWSSSATAGLLHGDDDRIVPIADSAMLSAKIIRSATLKVLPGAPHGICTTHKEQLNAELFSLLQARQSKAA
jgi:non-heme chloroperoxidase